MTLIRAQVARLATAEEREALVDVLSGLWLLALLLGLASLPSILL
jgi:hypothetical protein